MKKTQLLSYTQNIMQFGWGIVLLLFPLFILTNTTEPFILPKQMLVGAAALLSLVLFGFQAILEKKIKLRTTFLDLPMLVFLLSLLLSALFSMNRIDAITAFVPYIFLGIAYFILVNIVRNEQTGFFFLASLVVGAGATALFAIFTFFKAYLLPITFTKTPGFTLFGSMIDQSIFLVGVLPIALQFAYPVVKGKTNGKTIFFSVVSLLILGGLGVSVYQLFTSSQPTLLPFMHGFQIAFAAISQDTSRVAQGFFFGSGVGTFFTDFTRFKQASFNSYQNLWFLNFTQSSSYVFELLATTGLLGTLSFLFILARAFIHPGKTISNPVFVSLLIISILAFVLPFSFTTLALFFFLVTLFISLEGLKHPEKSFDLEFFLVTLRKNIFNDKSHTGRTSQAMPIAFAVILVAIVGVVGYFSVKYVWADMLFTQSLVAAGNNNGGQTYQDQVAAINMFPYRDGFYRVFSQTNLSIANSILALNNSNAKKNDQTTQQTQNTALNLIQQAITVSRSATSIAPLTSVNWQNVASIYRSLIGFGQGADNFTIAAMQQSIVLDPTNPQEYVALGGVYYQLGQYDNAIREFQAAANMKPDFANAYYNLGHAYEQKQDYTNALSNYQIVKQLVANDKTNEDKISQEIDALQKKTNQQANQPSKTTTSTQSTTQQEPLNIASPQTQLPPQPTQVPLVSPAPTK